MTFAREVKKIGSLCDCIFLEILSALDEISRRIRLSRDAPPREMNHR